MAPLSVKTPGATQEKPYHTASQGAPLHLAEPTTEGGPDVDPGLITAIVGALATIGGGAWKLIDRADKKREKREAAVEELLKAQAAKAEALAAKAEALAAAVERRYSRLHATATKWREQLISNHIDPLPADWPEETP